MTFVGRQCNDSGLPRQEFDELQAGERLPYYPDFDHFDTAGDASINERNYIGDKEFEGQPRRIEGATIEGLRNLS